MNNTRNSAIWLLLDSRHYGGIESHVLALAEGLSAAGQPVLVVLIRRYDKPAAIIAKLNAYHIGYAFLDDLVITGPQRQRTSRRQQSQGTARYRLHHSLLTLWRAIDQHAPKVIHAHGYKASILSKLARLRFAHQFKQLSCYHAGEPPKGVVKWYDRVDRYSAFLSDHSLCVSDAIANKLPCHARVVNNFIPMPRESHQAGLNSHKPNQVAFVGRLSHEKGPDRFVQLAKRFSHCPFHLYGTGEMQHQLNQDKPNNLTLHGFVNMQDHWHNIEILLITSRFEGLPMTAIEAMARGIVVLSLNVGAIQTLIKHQHNGFIAKDMHELATLFIHWQQLPTQRKLMLQQNAKKQVQQHFSTDAVVPSLIALYNH